MTAPIEVRGLSVAYGAAVALDSVSWRAGPGEFWAVVGPNGSGKSTLLKAALGLVPPAAGRVALFGSPPERFAGWRRVGYLPQFRAPAFPRFPATVREVVGMGCLAGKRAPRHLNREDAEAVSRVLDELGIGALRGRRVGELSGGQLQRTLLARALVNRPELLLLDEPAVALDPGSRESFFRLLGARRERAGTTVVLVTHDSSTAGRYADRLLYLDRSAVFAGTFESFCRSPDMNRLFGKHAQHLICHQHGGGENA